MSCSCSARSLVVETSGQCTFLLTNCSIPAPVLLAGASSMLDCTVFVHTGSISLQQSTFQHNFEGTFVNAQYSQCKKTSLTVRLAGSILALQFLPTIPAAYGAYCCGAIDASMQPSCNDGWLMHPALCDNSLQLGPACAHIRVFTPRETWVVAGLAAYRVCEQARRPS